MNILMLTLEAPKAVQFLDDFADAYAAVQLYHPADHREPLPCPPRDIFTLRRKDVLRNFIRSQGITGKDDPRAFLAEWTSYISLIDPLSDAGYDIDLAPETLETGQPGRHGIDLVVAANHDNKNAPVPLLGINVKLQKLNPDQRSERHHFDPAICAPSINMSLGNWEVMTREHESKEIRDWINELVLPKIIDTGKIPYLHSLRQYIIRGIRNTLDVYTWKYEQFNEGTYFLNEHQQRLLPATQEDTAVFHNKLYTAHRLFEELDERYC